MTPAVPPPSTSERRGAARLILDHQVTVSFKGPGSARWTEADASLVDISDGGMAVHCDRVPDPRQRVMVGFLWRGHGLCAASGRAIHFGSFGGFGVEFERTNFMFKDFLKTLALLSPSERQTRMGEIRDAQVWIE